MMEEFTIRLDDEAGSRCCAMCGEPTSSAPGPRLCLAEEETAGVCRACGKTHAPNLVALLDLACAAERVGRSYRHILIPPMEALLDLARAAEDYTAARPRLRKKLA
jgi:hypothetical protein